MNTVEIPVFQTPSFAAEAWFDGSALSVRLSGSADFKGQARINELLGAVHQEATRLGVSQVQVDLRHLEFMSSSCLAEFVHWIEVIEGEAAGRAYQVCFLSNDAHRWQTRSLRALCCLSRKLVIVSA